MKKNTKSLLLCGLEFNNAKEVLASLIGNWQKYEFDDLIYALNYIEEFRFDLDPLDIYYKLILELQIEKDEHLKRMFPILKRDEKNLNVAELAQYCETKQQYESLGESTVRESHKWAVANTWWYYNYYRKTLSRGKEGIPNTIKRVDDIFSETYRGKKAISESGFLLVERLWRVKFEDDSWVIAYDVGNGWYKPMTDFNSYKINVLY